MLACGEPSPPSDGPADPTGASASTGDRDAGAPAIERAPLLDSPAPAQRLGWPVERVHVTSELGVRVDPVGKTEVRMHRGVDFRGAPGDLVLAIAAGRIDAVGHDALHGLHIVVDHGGGVQSLYAHLSGALVGEGMAVARGAAIGLVGNTGHSEAPHLHLALTIDGRAVDPLAWIGHPLPAR